MFQIWLLVNSSVKLWGTLDERTFCLVHLRGHLSEWPLCIAGQHLITKHRLLSCEWPSSPLKAQVPIPSFSVNESGIDRSSVHREPREQSRA